MLDQYTFAKDHLFIIHKNFAFCPFPVKNGVVITPADFKENILFTRYSTEFDTPNETEWWHILKSDKPDLAKYDSNARRNIKKGLEQFEVKLIDSKQYADDIHDVYAQCLNRHGITPSPRAAFVEQLHFEHQYSIPVDYFGAFHDGKLIGYSKVFIDNANKFALFETTHVLAEYFKLKANFAIIYTLNDYYLNTLDLNYISDGTRSLLHPTNIQHYLIEHFKYRKAYCRLEVHYSPKIKFLVKMLSPFKKIISTFKHPKIDAIKALLEQERIKNTF